MKRLPILKVLALAEVVLLVRDHLSLLTPHVRRKLAALVRKGRGRRRNLTEQEREDLAKLVAKAEPRRFAGLVADKLSPVPLPKRLVNGPTRPRRGAESAPAARRAASPS